MEKQYESDEIEIDLKELFFEVLGEWKKIAISTILLALIMFVVSAFVITPQYQSTSKLYVLKNDTISSLTDIQIGSNLANDYMEIIDGRPVLEQVIANLGLDMTYRELHEMLSFTNPSGTRILEITVTHPDPKMAKTITDEMADVVAKFITEKMKQDEPSVLQYGYVSTSQVSPNVMQNTILGGLIGAFLAIAIVVVAYLMNDTIMTPDDMERKIGIRVLASLPFDEEEDDGLTSKDSKRKSIGGVKGLLKDDAKAGAKMSNNAKSNNGTKSNNSKSNRKGSK